MVQESDGMIFSKSSLLNRIHPPILIAEIGNNHEGNLNAALEMLEKAKEAGADLVKFQAGTAEGFARKKEDIPRYKKYELGKEGYNKLIAEGKRANIPVFFSVWSEEFAYYRRLDFFKIAARQANRDYIQRYSTDNTFISIPHTDNFPCNLGIDRGVIMHCVSEYPAKDPEFWRISMLRQYFELPIGYSDHSIGVDPCIHAVKHYKAAAIEKHFTLKHDFGPLRDHELSATPRQFKRLAEAVK